MMILNIYINLNEKYEFRTILKLFKNIPIKMINLCSFENKNVKYIKNPKKIY